MRRNIYETLRKGLVLAILACCTMTASAVPAKPGLVRTIQLVDGTTVTARLVGDEFGHYWLAENGKAYQANASGRYVTIDAQAINTKAAVRRSQANAQRIGRLAAPRKVGSVGNYTGSKKGLIILVNFKNESFSSTNAQWNNIANTPNYVSGKFKGSMYDYFYAQSDGQFQLTFDVVGPVTVSKDMSYYGSNNSNGDDMHPATMVREACQLANQYVNYADYDWDDDTYVDQVYVVYAGKGEADGGADETIWPHAWSLSSAGVGTLTLDGKKIDSYACGGELNGSTGAVAGPGTMCHEFSHCLGYPDFYDTDYSGGQGMGNWDLMDSGSYNGDGYQPAGYTSYERWVAGWHTPIELTASKAVTRMKSLQEGGESYIIYNSGNSNEYYLLENRQKTGWDASLPGKGLLIIHVDYNASIWNNNKPNDDPSHQRMTWIPADNQYQYYYSQGYKVYTESGMATDPFPYGLVNSFSANSTPAAKWYNKDANNSYYLDSSIENITQNSDKTISFNFKSSIIANPVFSPEPGQYDNQVVVTITSDSEDATIYYTTNGTTPTTNSKTYTGPFEITETTTLKAIAVANGKQSQVTTGQYVIVQTSNVATPSFSPAPGQYDKPILIKMSCETEGATIYYTTDGSTPTTNSTPYVKTFYIDESTTFKAIAVADGEESKVATAKYTIGDCMTFKRVEKYTKLVSGKRYIIAAKDKNSAAGPLVTNSSSSYLKKVEVNEVDDCINIGVDSDVLVFTLEGSGTSWTVKNEENGYLYSTGEKNVTFTNSQPSSKWTIFNSSTGVAMKYGSYNLRYNLSDPRFTTYNTTSNMVYANLYMEVPTETIKRRLPGDANGDGEVNISDVTLTVQHILTNYSTGFVFYNADVNEDGVVIVTDVSSIVDIILKP